MKTCRILVIALLSAFSLSTVAQEGLYLGEEELPLLTDSTAALQYYGALGDFTGGYQTGDIAADFTVYDLDGNPLTLSEKLAGDKPVIICSGSASCIRFTNCFMTPGISETSDAARMYMEQTASVYEWVMMYNLEAHPGDLENCSSNCPQGSIPAPNGVYIDQHVTYGARVEAAQMWMDISDDPEYNYNFPFNIYIDNPNNGVYNHFFERPFGIVVLDCAGEVLARGDWTATWLVEEGGIQFLNSLADQNFAVCGEEPSCTEGSLDTDGDGICDLIEEFYGYDINDPCDPDGEDNDGDGLCNGQEIAQGLDPNDPCVPFGDDADGDGFCDILENNEGSDPDDPCDPNNTDSDGDGYCDIEENLMDWDMDDPCVPEQGDACELCPDGSLDSDQDGTCDEQELADGTDPNDPCDPNDFDLDMDGFCDTLEMNQGSDPEDPCDPDDTDSDEDGYCDIEEILNGWDPYDSNDPDVQTGVSEETSVLFDVFPNPFSDQLTVNANTEVSTWRLTDSLGRSVAMGNANASQFIVDVSNVLAGTYFLQLLTNDGLESRQIVKY